jgi:hypothetical protein
MGKKVVGSTGPLTQAKMKRVRYQDDEHQSWYASSFVAGRETWFCDGSAVEISVNIPMYRFVVLHNNA